MYEARPGAGAPMIAFCVVFFFFSVQADCDSVLEATYMCVPMSGVNASAAACGITVVAPFSAELSACSCKVTSELAGFMCKYVCLAATAILLCFLKRASERASLLSGLFCGHGNHGKFNLLSLLGNDRRYKSVPRVT